MSAPQGRSTLFAVDDLIFYAGAGVCRVADVAAQDLQGQKSGGLYYVLKPLYQDYLISTPANAPKVFMRPIISRQEAERLIALIPSMCARVYRGRVFELAEQYQASFQKHDCAELIALTMSLHRKKQTLEQSKRKLGAIDERFMKRAEELLFGELAAALGIRKAEVQQYIADKVGPWEAAGGENA